MAAAGFAQVGRPSCCPTNSMKALMGKYHHHTTKSTVDESCSDPS